MPLVLIKSDKKARDKPCLRCGYSLRRIDSLHCPECGLSVWRSLNQNDSLDWSNPEWLKSLNRACLVFAPAQVLGFVAYLATSLLMFVSLLRTPWVIGVWRHSLHFLPFLATAYEVVVALGLILLSAEEGRHPDKWKSYRIACRVVAVIVLLIGGCTLLAGFAGLATRWASLTLTRFGLSVSVIAATLSAFAYLRKLAQRVPSSRVAWMCGWLLLGPAISLLKTVPFFSVWLAFEFAGLLAYLPLLYLPLTAALLIWFARAFRNAADLADKGWQSETAGTTSLPPG